MKKEYNNNIQDIMKRYDYPIVKTLLDTDAYKLHMQQAIFYNYKNVDVVAEFLCRGDNFFRLLLSCFIRTN